MSYSFPQLEAKNGRGFAHEIFVKGSMPREMVANVEGDPDLWPVAVLFAESPELLECCRLAAGICEEEYYPETAARLRSVIAKVDAAGQLASAQSARH